MKILSRAWKYLWRRVDRFLIRWVWLAMTAARFSVPPVKPAHRNQSWIVVSLTSIPERIGFVWVTLESLLRQTERAHKIVLVLSKKDFPKQRLPRSVTKRLSEDVSILWQEENIGSYKKVLPVLERYANHPVLTVDDDALYHKKMLADFSRIAGQNPGSIVGSRGVEVPVANSERGLSRYTSWPRATSKTQGNILLTGHGGILYPSGVLDKTPVQDYQLAAILCPNQDDIWLWAMALIAQAGRVVTPVAYYRRLPWATGPRALYRSNRESTGNDLAIRKVIEHFHLEL